MTLEACFEVRDPGKRDWGLPGPEIQLSLELEDVTCK